MRTAAAGSERGGWAGPLFDSEAMTFVDQVHQRADAFLFGRRTYEFFAGCWGGRADTTVLSGDFASAIGELKAKPAGELQMHGSAALTRWLLEKDLVDEMNLLIVPVVVGQARG